jgi:hypothetical protein
MRHSYESAAERLWKEKLEHCATRQEAVLLVVLLTAITAIMLTAA